MESLGVPPDLPLDPLAVRDGSRNGGLGNSQELPRDPLAGGNVRDSSYGVRENGTRDSFGVRESPASGVRDQNGAARDSFGVLRSRPSSDVQDGRGDRAVAGEIAPPTNGVSAVGRIGNLAVSLDEEERELWRQLRRKSEFELRVAEKRAQLAELRDRRRNVSTAVADAVASVDNLSGQLEFARMQEKEVEHDVAVLRESNRILQTAYQEKKLRQEEGEAEVKSGHLPHTLTEAEKKQIRMQAREKANVLELKREQEAVMEYEQITHLRAHLERLVAEKSGLQQRQQALLDKQHASEQDRNLLLSSLQEERKGINDLRHERLRLWEERHNMEREMTTIVQEAHFKVMQERAPQRYRGGVDPNVILAEENAHIMDPFAHEATVGKSVLAGGVRVPATMDTPAAFAPTAGDFFTWGEQSRKEPAVAQRKPWTSFAGDAVQRGGGVVDSGGAGFGLQGLEAAATGGSAGGAGITEWAGRMQEYRSQGSASPI